MRCLRAGFGRVRVAGVADVPGILRLALAMQARGRPAELERQQRKQQDGDEPIHPAESSGSSRPQKKYAPPGFELDAVEEVQLRQELN